MTHGTCPTVNIVADNEQGFIIINLSDFDDTVHKVFGEVDVATAKAQQEAEAARVAAEEQARLEAEKAKAANDALAAKANNVPVMEQGIAQTVQAPWLKPTA